MKLLLFVVLALLAVMVAAQDGTNRLDAINVDEVLKSDRLFRSYLNCLLDAGPCTPEGSDLKKYLADALETDCANCSEKQRETANKVIVWMIENRPEDWAMLKSRYDPDNKLVERYRELAAKAGLTL